MHLILKVPFIEIHKLKYIASSPELTALSVFITDDIYRSNIIPRPRHQYHSVHIQHMYACIDLPGIQFDQSVTVNVSPIFKKGYKSKPLYIALSTCVRDLMNFVLKVVAS